MCTWPTHGSVIHAPCSESMNESEQILAQVFYCLQENNEVSGKGIYLNTQKITLPIPLTNSNYHSGTTLLVNTGSINVFNFNTNSVVFELRRPLASANVLQATVSVRALAQK